MCTSCSGWAGWANHGPCCTKCTGTVECTACSPQSTPCQAQCAQYAVCRPWGAMCRAHTVLRMRPPLQWANTATPACAGCFLGGGGGHNEKAALGYHQLYELIKFNFRIAIAVHSLHHRLHFFFGWGLTHAFQDLHEARAQMGKGGWTIQVKTNRSIHPVLAVTAAPHTHGGQTAHGFPGSHGSKAPSFNTPNLQPTSTRKMHNTNPKQPQKRDKKS